MHKQQWMLSGGGPVEGGGHWTMAGWQHFDLSEAVGREQWEVDDRGRWELRGVGGVVGVEWQGLVP